jgi:hypothetical protein
MPGDGMDVQKPEDQQHDGSQAHEGQRHDEEQRETVQAVSPLPVATPPRLFEHRKRLGRHPRTDLTKVVGSPRSRSRWDRGRESLGDVRGGWHCGDLVGQPERSGAFGRPVAKDRSHGVSDGRGGDLVGHEHAGGACSFARACVVELIGALRDEHERQSGGQCGTKPALLAACAVRLVAGDEDLETPPAQRRWARDLAAAQDPHAKLVRYVQQIADVSPRITRLIDVLRATAPAEPDVATFLDEIERGRREGALQLLGHGTPPGTWQEGLTPDQVADITYAIASPDTLRALTDRCGWSQPQAQQLIVRALEHELRPNGGRSTH